MTSNKKSNTNILENSKKYNNDVNPIKLDCKELRMKRTNENIIAAKNYILNEEKNKKNINYKKLTKITKIINNSEEYLFNKAKSDADFLNILAILIAIESSRQGAKDEKKILEICNKICETFKITIVNLSATAYRPTKSGLIINNKEYQKYKKNECLKSFDAQISGKIKGWISCKICFTEGGHQDNVFEEMNNLCNWVVSKYKNEKNEFFILIIDTDLKSQYEELCKKYNNKNNIMIFNHYSFQKYIISNFTIN